MVSNSIRERERERERENWRKQNIFEVYSAFFAHFAIASCCSSIELDVYS